MKKQLLILTTALLSLSTLSQVPNYVPTNGLVGYWPFNGNANDESGNGNNGTVNGASLTSDRFGVVNSAYSFDGINDEVFANRIAQSSFSFSGWYNLNANQQYSPIIDAYNGNWELLIESLTPTFVKWISLPNVYEEYFTSQSSNINTWYHLVCSFSNNQVAIFLNGSLIQTFNNISLINTNGLYYFGKSYSGTIQYLNGKLDDIGIWNRALTACEIQDLYASQLNSTFVSAGIDESICNGEQVTLTASGSQNYSWNNGVVDGAPFSPTNTLDYIVIADSAGCQSADTLTVFVNQPTNSTLNETALDSFSLNGQTYTQSGTYTQVIPNAAGCDSTITLNLSLDFTNLQEIENSFTISPNPAKDQLNVLYPSGISEDYFLLDGQGRKVLAGKLTGTTTTIDISKLAAGNYLVQVSENKLPVRIVKN
jgi:hypothetical protein